MYSWLSLIGRNKHYWISNNIFCTFDTSWLSLHTFTSVILCFFRVVSVVLLKSRICGGWGGWDEAESGSRGLTVNHGLRHHRTMQECSSSCTQQSCLYIWITSSTHTCWCHLSGIPPPPGLWLLLNNYACLFILCDDLIQTSVNADGTCGVMCA